MSKSGEILSLTGLRGAAALFVVIYHLLSGMMKTSVNENMAVEFLRHGYLAVDLFFVLSGYVMALTYADLFVSGFRYQAFADFLGRRIGRVYPAYIAATAVVAAYDFATTPWRGIESQVALATNALMVQSWGLSNSIVGPGWSVSTEFAAYFFFPILVVVVLQRGRKWVWLSAALAVATLVFVATRSSATLHQGAELGARDGPLHVWGTGTAFLVLRCLGGFTLGMVGFRLAQHPDVKRQAGRMFAGDVAMASVILLMMVPNSDVALVLLFIPLIITLAEQRSLSAAFLSSPVMHWFGLISYSLYLVHQPIDMHIRRPVFTLMERLHVPHAYTVAALAISIPVMIVGVASYYGIEKPGRRWSRRLFKVGRPVGSRSTGTVVRAGEA